MPSLSSIFHRKSPSNGKDGSSTPATGQPVSKEAEYKADVLPEQEAPPPYTSASPYTDAQQPAPRIALQPSGPLYAPGTGPAAHAQMVQANNLGMLGGAMIGSATGGNPVTGMVEGQVVANMVMQRVQQEQRHQYYREQALLYRAGLPAAGVGELAPPSQPIGAGRDRSRSRSQRRDERRRKRWERRARRRDGCSEVGRNEVSSGSDSGY